jgi:putative ABC transport system permease protein
MSKLAISRAKVDASAQVLGGVYIFLVTSTRMALKQLVRHKMRSFLTILGILIGVSGVMTIVSLGEGMRKYFNDAMASQASADLIYIMPDAPVRNGIWDTGVKAFKNRDLEMIKNSEYVISAIGGHIDYGAIIKHGWRSEQTLLSMSPHAHFEIDGLKLKRGRFYTSAEERGRATVAVVGHDVGDLVYEKNEEVLGSTLQVNNVRFTVIGILEGRSSLDGGQVNKAIYIPLETGQERILKSKDIYWIAAQVRSSKELALAKEDIAAKLRASRRIRSGADDDFEITTPDDWADFANNFVNTLIIVFGVVAVIALLVGGIGVMNIMLVSVKERTREIGLRKALGATSGAITWQFLVESTTLTLVGGMIGLAIGYGMGGVATLVMNALWKIAWVPAIPASWVLAVMLCSVGIGLVFGVYPAWRAGKLDPIIALHYE